MYYPIKPSELYRSFDYSMQALLSLYDVIEEKLAPQEWDVLRHLYQEIFSLAPGESDAEEIHSIISHLMLVDTEDHIVDYKKVWDAFGNNFNDVFRLENGKVILTKEFIDSLKSWASNNPQKANIFFRELLKSIYKLPIKSELSRQGIFLQAVSLFDVLLQNLVREYFISTSGGAIEDVNSLDKEISSYIKTVIRGERKGSSVFGLSTRDKVDYLLKKFPYIKNFSKEKVSEIIETRNVFTHRGGRADSRYEKVNPNVKTGDRLRISKKYLTESISYLYIWGLIFCLLVDQKIENNCKSPKGVSTTFLQLIRDCRYELGTEFFTNVYNNISLPSKNFKDVLRINYALCLDKLGKQEEKIKVLSRINVSPIRSTPSVREKKNIEVNREPFMYNIPMCVSVLTGDIDSGIEYLQKGIEAKQITYLDLEFWPIFDYFNNDPRLVSIKKEGEARLSLT